jgi:hypothetical protein
VADDLTRKMGSDDDEANRVRIAGPSARGIVAKLEHRIVADLAEANQVVSNPQAAQPVEIEQPSDDQTPQPLTRISLQTKERMVAMKTRSRDCKLLVAIVRLDEAFCAPLTLSVPSQRRPCRWQPRLRDAEIRLADRGKRRFLGPTSYLHAESPCGKRSPSSIDKGSSQLRMMSPFEALSAYRTMLSMGTGDLIGSVTRCPTITINR